MSRLRPGEWLTALFAIATIALTFAPWSEGDSGWAAVPITAALYVLVALGGLLVFALVATQSHVALPVGVNVVSVALGIILAVVLVVRLLTLLDDAEWGLLVATLTLVGCVAAQWLAIGDETPRAPDAGLEVERRPAPPPGPAPV